KNECPQFSLPSSRSQGQGLIFETCYHKSIMINYYILIFSGNCQFKTEGSVVNYKKIFCKHVRNAGNSLGRTVVAKL
ncbi:hypothetical protein H5410_042816, partial [Solanum commersonii]